MDDNTKYEVQMAVEALQAMSQTMRDGMLGQYISPDEFDAANALRKEAMVRLKQLLRKHGVDI